MNLIKPKISVVIPLYNKVKEIKRALDSVLAQTYQDFEVIVVDDGSTDGSPEVVKSFNDPRITLIYQQNMYCGEARNTGIKAANGELIAFLDADDEWLPQHLETIVRLYKNYPECGLFSTSWVAVDSRGRCIKERMRNKDIPPEWEGIVHNYFRNFKINNCSNTVIPKSVFLDVGFFPKDRHGEDHDMWFRIAIKYKVAHSTYIGAKIYYRDKEKKTRPHFQPEEAHKSALKTLDQLLHKNELPPGVSREDILYVKDLILTRKVLLFMRIHKIKKARITFMLIENKKTFFNRLGIIRGIIWILLLILSISYPYSLINRIFHIKWRFQSTIVEKIKNIVLSTLHIVRI